MNIAMTPAEQTLELPLADGHDTAIPTPHATVVPTRAGWLAAGTSLLLVITIFILSCLDTPKQALENVFRGVVAPVDLSTASSMVDTNTWLTAKWDRSLADSFRTGKATVSLDIVGSLPDHALDAAAFGERQTYLDLFRTGKLHRVAEHATLTFVRDGLSWKLVNVAPAQLNAQARTAAYLSHATTGPVTFVADQGVYNDDRGWSSLREDQTHFGISLAIPLAITMLVMGTAIGLAKGNPLPVFSGAAGALVLFFGPNWVLGLSALTQALVSVQAWGIFG